MPKRSLMLLALILAGGCVYNLSFLHATFEPIMLETLRLSDLEFGDLRAILGVVMMLSYFPGGWLADRFSARNLITISLVSTGLSGFYMAAIPSMDNTYWPLFALHIFWGVSTTMTYWAALIKATHVWGRGKQGMAFGILESGIGAAGLGCTMLAIAFYDSVGQGARGLIYAIMVQTSTCLIAGVFAWFFIVDDDGIDHKTSSSLSEMLNVVRLPSVWLMSFIILCSYYSMWGTYNFAKYAVDGFEMEKVDAAYFSTVGSWVRCFVAFSAGFVADKLGVRRIIILSSLIGAAGFGVFTYGSVGKDLIYLLVINSLVISMGIYSLRGIYYALMKESHIPVHLVGAAVGIISFIGYTPDIFAPLVKGHLLDYFPYEPLRAHRYYFLTCVLAGVAGAIATIILGKIQEEKRFNISIENL